MGLPPERLSAEGTSLLDSRKSISDTLVRALNQVRMNENCSTNLNLFTSVSAPYK